MSSQVAFEPPADMYELDDAVMVRLEIAGLQPNYGEISVEIHDDRLTITGERRDPASGPARRYEQMEIETGPFRRTLHLSCPVDETAAVARYEDGFLVIRLPKRTAPRGGSLIVRID
jgi:HSP20 family protein